MINHRFTRSVTPNLTLAEKISEVHAHAEAYRVRLAQITSEMKQLISAKQAVDAKYAFTFDNSTAQGRKMVND